MSSDDTRVRSGKGFGGMPVADSASRRLDTEPGAGDVFLGEVEFREPSAGGPLGSSVARFAESVSGGFDYSTYADAVNVWAGGPVDPAGHRMFYQMLEDFLILYDGVTLELVNRKVEARPSIGDIDARSYLMPYETSGRLIDEMARVEGAPQMWKIAKALYMWRGKFRMLLADLGMTQALRILLSSRSASGAVRTGGGSAAEIENFIRGNAPVVRRDWVALYVALKQAYPYDAGVVHSDAGEFRSVADVIARRGAVENYEIMDLFFGAFLEAFEGKLPRLVAIYQDYLSTIVGDTRVAAVMLAQYGVVAIQRDDLLRFMRETGVTSDAVRDGYKTLNDPRNVEKLLESEAVYSRVNDARRTVADAARQRMQGVTDGEGLVAISAVPMDGLAPEMFHLKVVKMLGEAERGVGEVDVRRIVEAANSYEDRASHYSFSRGRGERSYLAAVGYDDDSHRRDLSISLGLYREALRLREYDRELRAKVDLLAKFLRDDAQSRPDSGSLPVEFIGTFGDGGAVRTGTRAGVARRRGPSGGLRSRRGATVRRRAAMSRRFGPMGRRAVAGVGVLHGTTSAIARPYAAAINAPLIFRPIVR